MTTRELARSAWSEIRAHKARSAMTCFSLAIGIAAMLFTFSQTAGMMKRFTDMDKLAGPGRMTIQPSEGYAAKGLSKGLVSEDAAEIRRQFPQLYMVYPFARRNGVAMRLGGFRSTDVLVTAVTEEWRKREWVYALSGRFINARDVADSARVCVLLQNGGWIKKPFWARYFPVKPLTKYLQRHDAVGRQVLLGQHVFTVIGVIKEPPRDRDPRWFHSGRGGQGTVFVPISAYERYLAKGRPQLEKIEIDTGDAATMGALMRRIEALMLARHRGEKDFEIKDFRQIMEGAMQQMRKFIASIMIIGIVAIVASGIGIMNVTLATIFSRIREIGIRRALGATKFDIVAQFVAEAMALGVVGGAAGTGLGAAAIVYLAPRAERMQALSPTHVAAALAIALGTGFLFALYPAYKASRFDPVEALRYE